MTEVRVRATVLVMLSLIAAHETSGQDSGKQSTLEGLALSVSSAKRELQLLEPLPLEIVFANRGTRTYELKTVAMVGTGYLSLEIASTNSPFREHEPNTLTFVSPPFRRWPPGDQEGERYLLYGQPSAIQSPAGIGGLVFPDPGWYRVRAKIRIKTAEAPDGTWLYSDEISVRVRMPQDREEKEALQLFGGASDLFATLDPYLLSEDSGTRRQRMEAVAELFSRTLYGRLAAYGLARLALNGSEPVQCLLDSPEKLREVYRYLRPVLNDLLSYDGHPCVLLPTAEQALQLGAAAAAAGGEPNRAVAACDLYLRWFPALTPQFAGQGIREDHEMNAIRQAAYRALGLDSAQAVEK